MSTLRQRVCGSTSGLSWGIGRWEANQRFRTRPTGRLVYRFHARDVNLIMGPPASGGSARFRVLIDGSPPSGAHGLDVDAQGAGAVTEPRMYQLIRQPGAITDREFEIQFLGPGVAVFDFTFG